MTHAPLTEGLSSGPHRTAAASVGVASLLRGPRRTGRLLGASPAGVYLGFDLVDGPDVLALLPTSSVRLPLGMVVAGTLPPIAGDPDVAVGEGAVSVGDQSWVPARWFDPRPANLGAADPGRVVAAARVLGELPAAEVGVDTDRARDAVAALVAGESQPARALLGGGPGLTPAGDDVLAGALAACALLGPATPPRAVAQLLAHARRATTSLSAALLSCAAAGQVVPEAARFLAALCARGDTATALTELRSVGSTSGTALAVGIVAALGRDRASIGDAPAAEAG